MATFGITRDDLWLAAGVVVFVSILWAGVTLVSNPQTPTVLTLVSLLASPVGLAVVLFALLAVTTVYKLRRIVRFAFLDTDRERSN